MGLMNDRFDVLDVDFEILRLVATVDYGGNAALGTQFFDSGAFKKAAGKRSKCNRFHIKFYYGRPVYIFAKTFTRTPLSTGPSALKFKQRRNRGIAFNPLDGFAEQARH